MSETAAAMSERCEHKDLIDRETAAGVRAAIQPFCQLDAFAGMRNGNSKYGSSIASRTARIAGGRR